MIHISHRVNTVDQLSCIPKEYGVEIDLRDRGDRIILQHDPFSTGEDFEAWLQHYKHRILVLNIKSEHIELAVLDLLKKHRIEDYFFLDCSFPMVQLLTKRGERRVAVRFSEFEPLENCIAVAGRVEWVWVDCFTKMPLTDDSYTVLKQHFRLCAVSPELQGRSIDTIADYYQDLSRYPVDAVCTKRPDIWQAVANVAK